MTTDALLQQEIKNAFSHQPLISDEIIHISVLNGIVTLTGEVDSYAKKLVAEAVVAKIPGIRALAEDIRIDVRPAIVKSDTRIAQEAAAALEYHTAFREHKITIKVEAGVIKLMGEVDWEFQRRNAQSAMEKISGIRSVLNLLTIRPAITGKQVIQMIGAAFHRSASLDIESVHAEVRDHVVTLYGSVRSLAEKADAEQAALRYPGIVKVINKLEVLIPVDEFED